MQITKEVERVRGYKLQQSEFHALAVLGPPGNCGSVGSVVPLAVTFGCEPQALAQMFTLDQLSEPLLDHLRVVSGRCVAMQYLFPSPSSISFSSWRLVVVSASAVRHLEQTSQASCLSLLACVFSLYPLSPLCVCACIPGPPAVALT